MSPLSRLLRPALLCLLLPLAACAGGDDDGDGPGPGVDGGTPQVPQTQIDVGPPSLSNAVSSHFEVSSPNAPDASFVCALPLEGFRPCAAVFDLPVPDGFYRIEVAAEHRGERDPSPAVHEWTIDTVPPLTRIDGAPQPIDNSPQATFWFSADDDHPGTFTCQLDGGPWEACVSPRQTPVLAEGLHRMRIRATDGAGNLEIGSAERDWRIDFALPDTTISEGPAALVTDRSATFRFASADAAPGSTFRCRIDSAALGTCASPITLQVLNDGDHVFEVWVVEPVGTQDPSPARWMWNVDSTPPTVTIVSAPLANTNDATPSFGWIVTGAATVECRVYGDTVVPFAPCTSPHTAATMLDGATHFELRATDDAGNINLTERHFTIDTVLPTAEISSGPAALGNDNTPTFAFAVGGGGVASCRFDGSAATACSSPRTLNTVADGSHTFTLLATDPAGNVTTVTYPFAIDTVAPTATVTGGPSTTVSDNTPTFTFQVSGATEVTCRLDAGSFAPCSSPYTAAALADGSHMFTLRTVDGAGNVRLAGRNFGVDTRPLSLTFTGGPTGVTNMRRSTFTWTSTGALTAVDCRYDASAFDDCNTTMALELPDGPHTFEVLLTGDTGDTFAATQSFTVDTVAPTAGFTGGPSGSVSDPSAVFTFDTGGAPVVTECRLYRQGMATGAYAPCASPHAITLAPPSTPYPYVFEVRVTDAAGNRWSAYRSFTFEAAP